MSYTSNMVVVVDKLNVQLKGVKNQDNMLRDIAVSLATSNVDRIHTEGKNVAGGKIGTYAESTRKIRKKKGRQISKVDLSFTGQLSKEFQADVIPGGWGAGFTTSYGSNLFKLLTDKYGDVWGITQSDNQAIDRIVSKEINKKLGI